MRPFSAVTFSFKAIKSLQSLNWEASWQATSQTPRKKLLLWFFNFISLSQTCHRIKKLNSEICLRSDGTKIDDSLMEMEDANVHHETLVNDTIKKHFVSIA